MTESDPRLTRPSLLLRLRDPGDSTSWATFVETYGPLIRGYCLRRGLQEADAADVGQEVLAQVALSIRTFEYQPDRGRFRDWLGTVVRNKLARYVAIRGRGCWSSGQPGVIEAIEAPGLDGDWISAFHDRVLEVALARIRPTFGPSTWDAFERLWIDGRSPMEVVEATGLSVVAVYAAKARVLRRLREEVLALAEEFPVCESPR